MQGIDPGTGFLLQRRPAMPEMMGIVLLAEMLSKDGRRPHEFEELHNRSRLAGRLSAVMQRLRLRWMQ